MDKQNIWNILWIILGLGFLKSGSYLASGIAIANGVMGLTDGKIEGFSNREIPRQIMPILVIGLIACICLYSRYIARRYIGVFGFVAGLLIVPVLNGIIQSLRK